jgi:hypothetical protein
MNFRRCAFYYYYYLIMENIYNNNNNNNNNFLFIHHPIGIAHVKHIQEQNMYNKIAKHNTRWFSNTTHNKSRSNQSNYIYFNLMYQSCPSENPRNCSRLSLEETFLCLF